MTQENPNKDSFEKNEAPKITPEKVEQTEISQEEFSEFANNEKENFKQETANEINNSNSVNLDEESFEKVKNETGIEEELAEIDKEAETAIAESQQEINQDAKTPEEIADNKKYEERLMGSLVALTGGEFEKEFGHDATIDENGYIIKADGTNTGKMPSMLDYYAEVKKNGGMSPDELRKNIKEEMEWEKNGKSENTYESQLEETEEVKENTVDSDVGLSDEKENVKIEKNLENIREEITRLETNTSDEISEKEKIEKLKKEQETLEKQRRENLIRAEKEKILQEKLNELYKQFEELDSNDFESVLKSGKRFNGESIESRSMGSIEPENAQFLAKAFKEGIKITLLRLLQSLPELLAKLDEDLTKQATEQVDKKEEEEKQKLEEEKKEKEEKIEEGEIPPNEADSKESVNASKDLEKPKQ